MKIHCEINIKLVFHELQLKEKFYSVVFTLEILIILQMKHTRFFLLFLHDSKIIFSPTFVMANSSGPGNARNLHFNFRQNTSSITTRVFDINKGNNCLPVKNLLKWGGVVKM